MTALPKSHGIKGKQGGWTPEKRLEQSARMRARKIWLKSTGPRTAEGKSTSSQNAQKHGRFSAESKSIRTWLCFISRHLKYIKAALRHHDFMKKHTRAKITKTKISQNELGNWGGLNGTISSNHKTIISFHRGASP